MRDWCSGLVCDEEIRSRAFRETKIHQYEVNWHGGSAIPYSLPLMRSPFEMDFAMTCTFENYDEQGSEAHLAMRRSW